MHRPTRLSQLWFGLVLMGISLIAILFTLAPQKVRAEFGAMVLAIFKETIEKIKELEEV